MSYKRFENKSVLVVGATGGIASDVCANLSREQASLTLFARDQEKLRHLQNTLPAESLAVKGDATCQADLESAVRQAVEKFGKLDVLIHAVGSIILKPIHNMDSTLFQKTLELNLISPFLAIKAVLRTMMQQKSGSVIVLSSVAGSKGLLNHEAISAAKGGLEAMIRSAAVTYAKRGIRFNSVALGLVDTPMAEFLTKNEISKKASEALHPMGRIGRTTDIAGAVLYLASDDSSWVTGTTLHVDGGMKAN